MAVNLSPIAGAAWQFFDANGKPLNGGLLNTYTAGTTTPQPTFTTSAGSVQNSNPIVLGADGRPPQEIWLTSGIAYKFVLTDSLLNLIGTYDNIMGVNDVSVLQVQWIATNLVPTFVSGSQFTVPGDQTALLTIGRRLQLIETAGTVVCDITASAFTTLTTVTVQFEDTNVVDSGISAISYSLLTSLNDAVPRGISRGAEITLASAATTNIGSQGSENIAISGTTTITAFDTVNKGILRWLRFTGSLQITNSASIITQNSANINTNAGDIIAFRSEGAGVWREITILPATSRSSFVAQGRLTLTSGLAVTTADVTAATSIFFSPYKGNHIQLFSGGWADFTFTEITLAVPATTAQMYDVFAFSNAGVVAIEALAWTSDTARATALVLNAGVYVKSGDATRLYVGSFRTTGSSGQTQDAAAGRYVWNYYNRVWRALIAAKETTDSWTYNTNTFRQANANTANQLDFITGVSEDMVTAAVSVISESSVAQPNFVSIGLGNTTPIALIMSPTTPGASLTSISSASWQGFPGIGRRTLLWLEASNGSGTETWFGDNGTPTEVQSGIIGGMFA